MNVVFFVVEFLHSQLWVVAGYFVDFVLEVGSKTFVNYFSSVLGTDDDMVVTEVDRVGIVYVFHASILSRGAEEAWGASIPRAYARGFLSAVK